MTDLDPRMRRAAAPVCKAWDIANIRFGRPDLDTQRRFLEDFGLATAQARPERLAMRAAGGYGPCVLIEQATRPVFLGVSLAVPAREDLDRLAALPGASAVEAAEDWAQGLQVRLADPAGNAVRAVFGPRAAAPPPRAALAQNLIDHRPRLNDLQRPPRGPSQIRRLGHAVINVVDFFACVRWYMDTFGLIASDVQTLSDGDPALVFLRCDRGATLADHHTLVIVQNVTNSHGHCAFECIDVDDIAMGQEHLQSRGWTHAWGLGRHLLGSQLFDYWRDPYGDKFEHFVDSDMFTADRPTDTSLLSTEGLYQWGPPLPKDFERPKLTLGFVWTAIRNVRASREMTFGRMRALLKAVGAPSRPWVRH
jgi:hypothetical protein